MAPADPEHHAANNPFWLFCKSVYGQRGVEQALLDLQDEDGADVLLVLFCCWAPLIQPAEQDLLEAAVEVSRNLQPTVIGPVRAARRALKSLPDQLKPDDSIAAGLRAIRSDLKASELSLEALQTSLLAALVTDPTEQPAVSTEQAETRLRTYFELAGLQLTQSAERRITEIVGLLFHLSH